MDRDGTDQEIHPGWRSRGSDTYSSVALSPDGAQLAISSETPEGSNDVYVKRLDDGPLRRLTFGGNNFRVGWSRDGQSVTYISESDGDNALWSRR